MSNFTDFISSGGGEDFKVVAVSGATQTMDLSQGNYFIVDGEVTQDTTLAFSNVPQSAKWNYSALMGASGAYNISTASYDGIKLNYGNQSGQMTGIFFKGDGTAFYSVSSIEDTVFQYSLSTAWDLSTSSFISSLDISSLNDQPTGLFFKPDGTKMYVVGDKNKLVHQYTLSTAWDISTASYDSVSFDVGSQHSWPNYVHFKPDGTKMYVVGTTLSTAYQYSLSTAWDISTASYSNKSFDFTLQASSAYSIKFKPDGSKMYILSSNRNGIYQYSLSTAWDISTATYDNASFKIPFSDLIVRSFFIKPDGVKMYLMDLNADAVHQYDIRALASVTLPSSVEDTEFISLAKNKRITYEFSTVDGGTNVQLLNQKVTP